MPILKSGNASICYEIFGKKTNPCVIFVMGITGQLIHWPPPLIDGLVDAGFCVITFDNRDVGLSSYYDDLPTPVLSEAIAYKMKEQPFTPPYTLNDMAHDIVLLMDGLAIKKAHMVGLSMGGQIAQIFALEYPERTLSLTLIATSSGDYHLPPPKPEILDFFFNIDSLGDDLQAWVERHLEQYKLYNHPDDLDLESMKKLYEKSYERAYHPEGNRRQLLAMIFAEPRGEKLKKLHIPALIIHGDYDPAVPVEHGKHLAKCIPNSQLKIIKKMGHGLPARIHLQLVDWLKDFFTPFTRAVAK